VRLYVLSIARRAQVMQSWAYIQYRSSCVSTGLTAISQRGTYSRRCVFFDLKKKVLTHLVVLYNIILSILNPIQQLLIYMLNLVAEAAKYLKYKSYSVQNSESKFST
jgi:hypothetical protein